MDLEVRELHERLAAVRAARRQHSPAFDAEVLALEEALERVLASAGAVPPALADEAEWPKGSFSFYAEYEL